MEKFTAETILSGKFNFQSAAEAKKKHQVYILTNFIKMSLSNVNSSQKSKCKSSQPELIDLTQDEFVDLTQEISDNSRVTHISETQMVVSNDTSCYHSDSSSKSERPGIYNLNFYRSINVNTFKNFKMQKNPNFYRSINVNTFKNFKMQKKPLT